MNVVWLKRDVRVHDHEPLSLASKSDLPCIVLYVYEPQHMSSDTYHEAHHNFINDGLAELDAKIQAIAVGGDGGISVRTGDMIDVLRELHARIPIQTLFSHREVGNCISNARNARVTEWTAANGVHWIESQQDGVSNVRHEDLDEGSWAKKWSAQMQLPRHPAPTRLVMIAGDLIERATILDARACGVAHLGHRPGAQRGGESVARAMLRSFLERRGEGYCEELSSPLTGWDSCSRLSPYLAWGQLSLRTVFQELSTRQEAVRALKKGGAETGRWLKSLAALGSRLRWRSHFAQKLHDQPSIEGTNLCRAYDALRNDFDRGRFEAWVEGRTGFPMVDACMRALRHAGWLNFRMRCMLVSFACYDCWLDWRPIAPVLARLFLDYEPGIHYPQLQMQAGTTGINANRCAHRPSPPRRGGAVPSTPAPFRTTLGVHTLSLELTPVVRVHSRSALSQDLQRREAGRGARGAQLRVYPPVGAGAGARARGAHVRATPDAAHHAARVRMRDRRRLPGPDRRPRRELPPRDVRVCAGACAGRDQGRGGGGVREAWLPQAAGERVGAGSSCGPQQ